MSGFEAGRRQQGARFFSLCVLTFHFHVCYALRREPARCCVARRADLFSSGRQAYVAAWSAHLVWASCLSFVSVLVLVPASRKILFPPTTASLITAGPAVDGPALAETVEHDAAVFVDGLEGLTLARTLGDITETSGDDGIVTEPDGQGTDDKSPRKGKGKKGKGKSSERDEMMRKIGTLVMQLAGDLADGWERWAKWVIFLLTGRISSLDEC